MEYNFVYHLQNMRREIEICILILKNFHKISKTEKVSSDTSSTLQTCKV